MKAFSIGRLVRGSNFHVKRFINSQLKEHHLSEGHFEYFIVIAHHEGINQKELGIMMNTGKAGVAKAVKRLVVEDLIYKKVNETDQRNVCLHTTEKGQQFVSVFHKIAEQIDQTVFENFTEVEKETLLGLLEKMYKNSEKL